MLDIARLILREREAAGFSQQELANRSGVSRITLARLETGRANPSVDVLERIASGFGKELRLSFELADRRDEEAQS